MPQVQNVHTSLLNLDHFLSYSKDDAADFHEQRKKAMLSLYGPQIQKLYGHCPRTKYIVCILVAIQLAVSVWVSRQDSLLIWLATTWIVGGTIAHVLSLAIHEITHYLAFKKPFWNWVLAGIADLPFPVATCVAFKEYHKDHHNMMGVEVYDTDIPTFFEGELLRSKYFKFFNVACQSLIYTLRPMFTLPKPLSQALVINWTIQLIFDAIWIHFFGWKTMLYLFGSIFLGLGLHPLAGHYISEHFVTQPTQDTYSYYGWLNVIAFNVGYHTEHHDFPNIPGSRLPQLRKIAPEFYDNRYYYTSWVKVLWDYVMTDGLTPFNRKKMNKDADVLKYRDPSEFPLESNTAIKKSK